MKRSTKPTVTLRCPANAHTGPNERVIEFSSSAGGGLISFVVAHDAIHVHVYRHDRTVHVSEGDRPK